jgi:hypothetical protein
MNERTIGRILYHPSSSRFEYGPLCTARVTRVLGLELFLRTTGSWTVGRYSFTPRGLNSSGWSKNVNSGMGCIAWPSICISTGIDARDHCGHSTETVRPEIQREEGRWAWTSVFSLSRAFGFFRALSLQREPDEHK